MARGYQLVFSTVWPRIEMKKWISEVQTENLELRFGVSEFLHAERSSFQELVVVDTIEYGKMLLLDGTVQTTVGDEFVYHEMISHVPLLAHPAPGKVIVIGGGDGGTVREIVKHTSVKHVVLVEIDEAVVKVSKEYLPEISSALDDERVNVVIDDGIEYLRNSQEEFDVVIIDSTDPVGPAEGLFSREFYALVYSALKSDGIMVAQTGSPFSQAGILKSAYSLISGQFDISEPYLASIPTYPSGLWSFVAGSKGYDVKQIIDANRADSITTRYYTAELHRNAFALPAFVKKLVI